MPIFRFRDSWEPLRDLERLLEAIPIPTIRVDRQFPPVNLFECDDEYLLTAELPGVATKDLELSVSQGVLTLKGKRAAPDGVRDDQFRRHERMWGEWERSLPVPERVVEEQISVEFNDGVLKVHLPKAPEAKPRRIQVIPGSGQ